MTFKDLLGDRCPAAWGLLSTSEVVTQYDDLVRQAIARAAATAHAGISAADRKDFVFAEARTEWERQFDGSFDLFVAELMFRDEAWLKSSYRGQQRHGRGYRDDVDKQLVKLFIF